MDGRGSHRRRCVFLSIQPSVAPDPFIHLSQGEKGSVNVKVSVNVPGGHSSIPCVFPWSYLASLIPQHTALHIPRSASSRRSLRQLRRIRRPSLSLQGTRLQRLRCVWQTMVRIYPSFLCPIYLGRIHLLTRSWQARLTRK